MTAMTGESTERSVDEFSYFTMRVRRTPEGFADGAITGVIECLGAADKHPFESGEELLSIVSRYSDRRPNMASGIPGHKASPPAIATDRSEGRDR
jgi:hypothetical protein